MTFHNVSVDQRRRDEGGAKQMKVSSVPFSGTKEQEAKLLEVIAKYKDMKGALMPIMQEGHEGRSHADHAGGAGYLRISSLSGAEDHF